MNKPLLKWALHSMFVILALLSFTNCASSPEETLEKIANEVRLASPQVIDEYTSLINCEVLPSRTLKFTYKLRDTQGDPTQEQADAMKKILIDNLKKRNEIEFYLVNNVRFEYHYLDESNQPKMVIAVEALDYK